MPHRAPLVALVVLLVSGGLMLVFTGGQRAPQPTAFVHGVSLKLELATSTGAQERGLGGRSSLPTDYGMLFVFNRADAYGFWMKDMLVPIDILWLDAQGHVLTLAEDVATSSYPHVFYPTAPAQYVLETAAGFSAAARIATGTQVELQNLPNISE
jgi:uncharacterized protein